MIFRITYSHWIKDRATDTHISVAAVDHTEAEDWADAAKVASLMAISRDAIIISIEDVCAPYQVTPPAPPKNMKDYS
jgi:hypothetical protein